MDDKFINPVRNSSPTGPLGAFEAGDISNGVKVTNALYRILDALPDNDPLKNKAKEKALAILENLTLKTEKPSAQLLDDILVLENYLKIGRGQGWIDPMNFFIITKEYGLIGAWFQKQFPGTILRPALPISTSQFPNKPEIINPKEIQNSKSATVLEVKISKQEEEKYSERQRKILQILQKRDKAQVADFVKELPDITKRTIRRDLDDLLKRGRVVRVGEWNQVMYQIVKNN